MYLFGMYGRVTWSKRLAMGLLPVLPCAAQFTDRIVDLSLDAGAVLFVDGTVAPDGTMDLLGTVLDAPPQTLHLCRFDLSGEPLWARTIDPSGAGYQILPQRLVRQGDALFAFGTYTDANAFHYFIARTGQDGSTAWIRTYRTAIPGTDYGFSSLVATTDGDLVMTMGYIDRTVALRLDTTGAVLWANEYRTPHAPTNKNPGFDMAATSDGGVLLTQKAENDIHLIRLLPDGSVLWTKRYPDAGYCHPHCAIELGDGGFLVAGSRDALPFAARTNAQGALLWFRTYSVDAGALERFDHAVQRPDGSLWLSASPNSSGLLGLHLDASGQLMQAYTLSGGGTARALGIRNGQVPLVGHTEVLLDDVVQDMPLLIADVLSSGATCLQAITSGTHVDVTTGVPLEGCQVIPETILTGLVDFVQSAPPLAVRAPCPTLVPAMDREDPFGVWPSVCASGDLLTVHGVAAGERVVHWTPFGTRTELPTGTRVNTAGWPCGVHLLQRLGRQGVPRATVRVVVQ